MAEYFGQYELEKVIGQGGMGRVYRAVHRGTGRRVALKISLSNGWGADQRFVQEAEILEKLRGCPQILDHFEHGEIGGVAFIAMELLQGQSLRSYLQTHGGKLSEAEALEIMRQTCVGVAYAHERKVLHRDLKPENLFVTKNVPGYLLVKVIDFGLAKREIGVNDGMTMLGTGMGTPGYMAPEQAADAANADERADVFGLGCVAFELLTGKDLYPRGCSLTEVQPFFPRPSNVCQDVWSAVMRATSPDLATRQRTVREFWDQLERAAAAPIPSPPIDPPARAPAQPVTPPPPAPVVKMADRVTEMLPNPPQKTKGISREALMVGFVTTLLITLGALMASAMWRGSRSDPFPPVIVRQTDPPRPTPVLPQPVPAPVTTPTMPVATPRPTAPVPIADEAPPPPRAPQRVTARTTRPSSDVVGAERTRTGYRIPHPDDWGEPDVIRTRPATCRGLRARGAYSSEFHAFCDGY